MNTITIDCGASFIKGALYCGDEMVAQKEYSCPHEGRDLLSPSKATAVMELVKKLLRELCAGISEAHLCISNEMHGFLLTDESFSPVTEFISWQWELGKAQLPGGTNAIEWLKENIGSEDLAYTGMPLRAGLPSSNLTYLKLGHVLSNTRDRIYFLTLGDWIMASLSGECQRIHPTNAAATGLYDLRISDWNWSMIDRIVSNRISFPEIGVKPFQFEIDGTMIEAAPAIGDQQAALFGAGLTNRKDISFNLGTGAQVSMLCDDICLNKEYQIRPFFDEKYIKTIPHIPCGRALNVYLRFIQNTLTTFGINKCEDEIWSVLQCLPEEDSTLRFDLSYFENAVTEHTTGSITNISEDNMFLASFVSAMTKQIADNAIVVADRLCDDRKAINRLILSGGVAKKNRRISDRIIQAFPDAECIFAENETMIGLKKYGDKVFHKVGTYEIH